MASLLQLKARLKVVANIKKITKAMKMVAAAKLRSVENQLHVVRNFQAGLTEALATLTEVKDKPKKKLLVCITSDRGLCGALNSTIARQARPMLNSAIATNENLRLVTFGEKGRSAMERVYGRVFALSFNELYRNKTLSFRQVLQFADFLRAEGFDEIEILYNRFKNLLTFEPKREKLYSYEYLAPHMSTLFSKFELENNLNKDLLKSLFEFRLAIRLFHMLQESVASEQSARMNAMDNSSKSASEMQDSLRLVYNRTRQSKITTELIEIISGSVSQKKKKDD